MDRKVLLVELYLKQGFNLHCMLIVFMCLVLLLQSFSRVSLVATVNVSRFDGIPMASADPILGVSETFKANMNEKKLNLGVGAYRIEELRPCVLNVVKKVRLGLCV